MSEDPDQAAFAEGPLSPQRLTLLLRLAVGLAQGLAAWTYIEHAKAVAPELRFGLALVIGYIPMVGLAGLGRMRAGSLAAWAAGATLLLLGLGFYAHWREPGEGAQEWWSAQGPWAPSLAVFGAAALYIGHHLLEPADQERRFPPTYPALFDGAWRHVFQLALSILFCALFWGVLELGALLFDLIGLKGLREHVLHKSWFASPATCLAFAAAVHLTDVRPALIRGVRTVALTLMAWLLPLISALAFAFLLALPLTGFGKLWATRNASEMLLEAAAVIVILVNAAYQDGRERETLSPVLRYAGRGGALLLIPLTGLAGWAAILRVWQHGLTAPRIVSFTVLVVGLVYALGYGWAAASRGRWMKRLEAVNIANALLSLGVILALLSPLADPSRLSVGDQMARLKSGRTAPAAFDYAFLRFRSARFGTKALAELAKSPIGAVADRARRAQAMTSSSPIVSYAGDASERGDETAPPFAHARVFPAGATLPQSFLSQAWTPVETFGVACVISGSPCDLYVRDLDGDGKPEVLSVADGMVVFKEGADGRWAEQGDYDEAYCPGVKAAVLAGQAATTAPILPDLMAAGQRLSYRAHRECAHPKPPTPIRPDDRPHPAVVSPAFARP